MESGVLSLPTKQQSFRRNRADSATWRTGSMSFSRGVVDDLQLTEDFQSEIVARAGDAGDRDFSDDGRGGSCRSLSFNIEELRCGEIGVVPNDSLVQLNGFWFDGASSMANANRSPVSPLQEEIVSPLSSDAILHSKEVVTHKGSQEQSTPQQVSFSSSLLFIYLFVFNGFGYDGYV